MRQCRNCKNSFLSSNVGVRFCSNECNRKYHNSYEFCQCCNKKLTQKQNKYCSVRCINLLKPKSDIHKIAISLAKKGSQPWNKKFIKDTDFRIAKYSQKLKGTPKSEESKLKNRLSHLNKVVSAETRMKQRIAAINRVKSKGFKFGNNEKNLLDFQEQINCKIIRQFYTGIGYVSDGYCLKTNAIYEVYERAHLKKIKKDLIRQLNIMEYLKCEFIILHDNWLLKEITNFIEKFKEFYKNEEYKHKIEINNNNTITHFRFVTQI